MKLLKLAAYIVLVLIIYVISNLFSFFLTGLYYYFQTREMPTFQELNNLFMDNILLNLIITSLIASILFVLILLIRRRGIVESLTLTKISGEVFLNSVILGAGVALFLNSIFSIIEIQRFFPEDIQLLDEMIYRDGFLLRFLSIGLIVPAFEEFMYRGMIFNELRDKINIYGAVAIQAVIFGIAHGNFYQFIYAVPAGVLLALVFLWTNSLWTPIIVHVAWNIMSLLMSEFLPEYIPLIYNSVFVVVGFGLAFFGVQKMQMFKRFSLGVFDRY